MTFKINPEILSDKPTHIYNGLKVKVFTYNCDDHKYRTAEIMEGPDSGKWTTLNLSDLVELSNETNINKLELPCSKIP